MRIRETLESRRIEQELAGLGSAFAEDGIVRTVLRERIAQERQHEYYSVQKAPRCKASTKAGKACPNPAKKGTERCVRHK